MTDPDPQLAAFLDLATRRLADDAEARDEARHELLVRLTSVEGAGPAAARLAQQKTGHPWFYPAVVFTTLAVLGAVAGFFVRGTIEELKPLAGLRSSDLGRDQIKVTSSSQEDFVTVRLGNDASTVLRNLEQLVRERPDDPGLFEEYTGQSIAALHSCLRTIGRLGSASTRTTALGCCASR